jgi:hypothetical protein
MAALGGALERYRDLLRIAQLEHSPSRSIASLVSVTRFDQRRPPRLALPSRRAGDFALDSFAAFFRIAAFAIVNLLRPPSPLKKRPLSRAVPGLHASRRELSSRP